LNVSSYKTGIRRQTTHIFEETVTFLKHLYTIHIYTVFAVYGFLSKEERYSS